jgi:hypothetical protein
MEAAPRLARRARSVVLRALGWSMASGGIPTSPARFDIRGWTEELGALTRALAAARIEPLAWQEGVNALYARVDIPTLLAQIDFEALRDRLRFEDGTGERFGRVSLPGKRGVVTKVAAVRRGAAIPPHGHRNMVSAFLVLSGEFHLRLYERLGSAGDACLLRPTADRTLAPGAWTSSSDQRNNVHWLSATAEDTYLFSAKRVRIRPAAFYRGRQYLDPCADAKAATPIRAPWISREEAYARFGGAAPPPKAPRPGA